MLRSLVGSEMCIRDRRRAHPLSFGRRRSPPSSAHCLSCHHYRVTCSSTLEIFDFSLLETVDRAHLTTLAMQSLQTCCKLSISMRFATCGSPTRKSRLWCKWAPCIVPISGGADFLVGQHKAARGVRDRQLPTLTQTLYLSGPTTDYEAVRPKVRTLKRLGAQSNAKGTQQHASVQPPVLILARLVHQIFPHAMSEHQHGSK